MKLGVLTDAQREEAKRLGFTLEGANVTKNGWDEKWQFWDDYGDDFRHVIFSEAIETVGHGKTQTVKSKILVHINNKVSAEIYTKVAQVLAIVNS